MTPLVVWGAGTAADSPGAGYSALPLPLPLPLSLHLPLYYLAAVLAWHRNLAPLPRSALGVDGLLPRHPAPHHRHRHHHRRHLP